MIPEPQVYESKKSKFYSFIFEINNKEELKNIEIELKNQYKKATHVCYGYVFKENGILNAGFNDDNEPNGTAGKPIRDLLLKKNINNIAIFVIRYFGGIKLGASGLTRAYLKSASLVLNRV